MQQTKTDKFRERIKMITEYKGRWWLEAESNCRHKDFQSFALPTELSSHFEFKQ